MGSDPRLQSPQTQSSGAPANRADVTHHVWWVNSSTGD
ncbi:Uncharacterised protein [Vibrio cholerae]|nr:Uncharacterised protein [Vibrio cholerae]